jgi:hypothetical protein
MASTLDPDQTRGTDRITGKGHGTGALGPSDSSDSGSDVRGGIGLAEGDLLGLGAADNNAPDLGGTTAGPDVGDANLDSDTDRYGTGERRAAGRDPDEPADIDRRPDRVERLIEGDLIADDEVVDLAEDENTGADPDEAIESGTR